MSETDDAIEEGKIAHTAGEPRTTNPYVAETQPELHEAWNAGWDHAAGYDDNDEPRDE